MRGIRPPPGRVPHVPPEAGRSQWHTVRLLLPYLWAYRARAVFAVLCLIAAKMAVVGVPVLLKHIVDRVSVPPGAAREDIEAGFSPAAVGAVVRDRLAAIATRRRLPAFRAEVRDRFRWYGELVAEIRARRAQ